MKSKEFTDIQPKDGDTMLHCGHLKASNYHFFKASSLQFLRPDGSIGEASWIFACEDCYKKAGGNPHEIEIRGDDIWQGNEPAVTRRVGESRN